MVQVTERLERFRMTTSLEEAEFALDAIAEDEYPGDLALGDLYDSLAEAAAEEDDYARAVRTQRKAIELGCDYPDLGREMLAWYLLKDGQTDAGEALFRELMDEHGGADGHLWITIGNARLDAGLQDQALRAFDEALTHAKSCGDLGLLQQARAERRQCRVEAGLPADGDDRLAPKPNPPFAHEVAVAVAWFPPDQHGSALRRWPDLAVDLGDRDAYCRRIEMELRWMLEVTGRNPAIAPIDVDALTRFAEEQGLDPADGVARSRYAAETARATGTVAWPPGRNEPCWCRSRRKYKRCCGRA